MAETENKEVLHPRENNRTNRERRERETKQMELLRKIGYGVGALVIVILIVGLIYGLVVEKQTAKKVIATVGEETITVKEYQEAVKAQRQGIIQNYNYMAQLYSAFGMAMDENTKESYRVQLSDDFKGTLGQQVLSNMVDKRILAYGAEKEGITVSDEEVEERLQDMFGYYPNGTPTAGPTEVPFEATPTVSQEQLDILRYTETPVPTEIPAEEDAEVVEIEETVVEEAVEVEAEAVETEEEVSEEVTGGAEEEVVAEAAETSTEAEEAVEELSAEEVAEAEDMAAQTMDKIAEALEPTPVPTEYTADMYAQNQELYFSQNSYLSREYLVQEIRYELLQTKVQEMLGKDVAREADMVWARHILVETEEEAKAVKERLDNGEEWGDLAAELSLDTGNAQDGGDLGWFAEGKMVPEFNDAAFAQEVGTVSDPVQTDFGWHLIQIVAHESHPLTRDDYQTEVELLYGQWLEKYQNEIGNVEFETDYDVLSKFTPNVPSINF